MNVERHPIPMNVRHVEHILYIGDTYQHLQDLGGLDYFGYEPRETYTIAGKETTYYPDAIFKFRGKYFILEVQRSYITSKRWAMKWAKLTEFYDYGLNQASFQQPNKMIRPRVIVISTQQEQTIQAGSRIPLIIIRDYTSLKLKGAN